MLPGDYISGFVDGEGCFSLRLHRDIKRNRPGSPIYLFWKPEFCIFLRVDDKDILEQMKASLDCGKITTTSRFVRYSVQDTKNLLTKVIPFFKKYPLRAKKKLDFEIWAKAIELIHKNSGRSIARDLKENSETFKELKNISSLLTQSRNISLPLI